MTDDKKLSLDNNNMLTITFVITEKLKHTIDPLSSQKYTCSMSELTSILKTENMLTFCVECCSNHKHLEILNLGVPFPAC